MGASATICCLSFNIPDVEGGCLAFSLSPRAENLPTTHALRRRRDLRLGAPDDDVSEILFFRVRQFGEFGEVRFSLGARCLFASPASILSPSKDAVLAEKQLFSRPVTLYRRRASALCDSLRMTALCVNVTPAQNLPQN
jgi:hypothetical protein